MSTERVHVFISSTLFDLPQYRQVVIDTIRELGFYPQYIEQWSDISETLCQEKIAQSQVFLGIYTPHIASWSDDKHIAQLEYDLAEDVDWNNKPIPRLCFMMAPDNATTYDDDLKRFKNHIHADLLDTFTSPYNLRLQLLLYLHKIKATFSQADAIKWEVGARVDRYILRGELGRGGNGQVWIADEQLPDGSSRMVAIKVLHEDIADDPIRVERFKREISIMARISHANIVPILNFDERESQLFVIMPFLSGGTLRQHLPQHPLPIKEALHWLEQIGDALDYVHDRHYNLIHRDVKPENMLIGDDGQTLYLADFGLVFSLDDPDHLTRGDKPAGTGRYMAPEQWRGQTLSRHTDLYALGILAYELLTGELPYQEATDYLLAAAHCDRDLPDHPALPDEVLRILRKATEEKPENRYMTARAFLTDLRNWDTDPANLNPRIADYLKWMTDDIYDRMLNRFVELTADEVHQKKIESIARKRPRKYAIFEDDHFEQATTTIHADHISSENSSKSSANMDKKSVFVDNVRERLMILDKAVLIGEPGSGKSFMLLRLSIDYMDAWVRALKSGDTDDAKIPVMVMLNEYKGGRFVDFVRESMDILGPYHDKLLSEGKLVLLCDALNEMPRTAHQMDDLLAYLSQVDYFVVSCRVRDYRDELDKLKPLEQIRLHDLELPAIKDLIDKRLPQHMARSLWKAMGGNDKLMKLWRELHRRRALDKFWDATAEIPHNEFGNLEDAWEKMHTGARLLPLARNPYMAEMLCRTYRQGNGQLPSSRAELFRMFFTQMLRRESRASARRGEIFPPRDAVEQALTELARALQESQQTAINYDKAVTIMSGHLLKAATDANILKFEGNYIKFAHQLLQEYFAARVLLEKMVADENVSNHAYAYGLFDDDWWDAGVWRETSVILGEFLGEGAQGANRVAQWLAPVSPEVALQVITRNGAGLTLADVSSDTREALITSAFEKTSETHPVGRATAYRVLGLLQADTRNGVDVVTVNDIRIPDIIWCEVPAGDFLMGSDKTSDPRAYDDEMPQRKLQLPTYYIARHAITNAQYQAFINAGGYSNHDYWTDAGWEMKNDNNWTAPQYDGDHISNQPVVHISWYEAYAVTQWLNAVLIDSLPDTLPTRDNYEIRLPTEAEWEKASRGTDGRIYPYGDTFDKSRGNTFEMGVRQPSAVGIFASGESPYHVLDMSGNVYDWCLTKWRDSYNSPEDNNPQGTFRRVVRGGSFANGNFNARCAYRYNSLPRIRRNYYGIRCVYAPKL